MDIHKHTFVLLCFITVMLLLRGCEGRLLLMHRALQSIFYPSSISPSSENDCEVTHFFCRIINSCVGTCAQYESSVILASVCSNRFSSQHAKTCLCFFSSVFIPLSWLLFPEVSDRSRYSSCAATTCWREQQW